MLSARTLAWIPVIVGALLYRAGDLLQNGVIFRSNFPRGYIANGNYSSECEVVPRYADSPSENLSLCEDETFWELFDTQGEVAERAVIVSCDPGRKTWNTVMGPLLDPTPHGGLWIYVSPDDTTRRSDGSILDPSLPVYQAHRITLKNYPEGHDFHPLGLEIWPSYSGNSSNLYVINHAREATVIEHFLLNPAHPTEAMHIRTLRSLHFHSANGLALTSPDSFYVANDHLVTRRLPVLGHILPMIESVLSLPSGFVSHITLNKHTPTESKSISEEVFVKLFIPFANGLAISSSGTQLALASTSMGEILLYERDPKTNKLKRKTDTIRLPFFPDNVNFSPSSEGVEEIIVGGHPNFPDLIEVAEGKSAGCPSWVIAIVPQENSRGEQSIVFDQDAPVSLNSKIRKVGPRWTMKTLFQSDGVEEKGGFSSSTTGLMDPNTGALYVTGIYSQGGMMVCTPGSTKVN
ncbi:hypothetical protein JR316_0005936 [Psilocybe cubensis]|uniref:Uncharacterized protein n=2 Tax=Psilocybe cubensis TaxID=181762 RepID=A0ACB8H0Z9_PSICU|nr:hypothetical protein JR316_0005936 [Psilocybe cubensis]KAH9481410.1 hypothetical protein JR316_0005936 [Psilocybe cubensis]